jgi:hypothetical protein
VPILKLHGIYVLLGISTLALNLALTMHLFRSHNSANRKEIQSDNDLITFRLIREHNSEGITTAAVAYDDTALLE